VTGTTHYLKGLSIDIARSNAIGSTHWAAKIHLRH